MIRQLPHRISTALLALLGCVSGGAHAAAICGVTASTMNFGTYDVLTPTPTDSSTTVTIICIRNPPPGSEIVNYTLSLSVGAGSYAARTMSNGPATLNYNLHTDPTRTPATIWGDGTSGSVTVSGATARLNNQNPIRTATHTIYGRIPAQQDVPVGTYNGSVILTMDY